MPRAWLGANVGLQIDPRAIEYLNKLSARRFEDGMQLRAWGNLPILNQWKRRCPEEDPVEVHRRLWHTELVCPGGGRYVWNEQFQTMESTVYGHPGQPKAGPAAPPVLAGFGFVDFGLSFEDQGLRAAVRLERAAVKDAGKKQAPLSRWTGIRSAIRPHGANAMTRLVVPCVTLAIVMAAGLCGCGEVESQSLLPATFTKLLPLHTKLGPPQPRDWLAEHKEPGQS